MYLKATTPNVRAGAFNFGVALLLLPFIRAGSVRVFEKNPRIALFV